MAVLTGQFGTLATFTSNTTGTNSIVGDGCEAIYFLYTSTGAATNTIKLQRSLDNGTTWIDVAATSSSLLGTNASTLSPATGAPVEFGISQPVGLYRAVCTAHNAGTHTVQWRKGFRA